MREVPTKIGPYEIRGELGRGGMGVVYRVHRADLGRDFALKLVLNSARLNESMMKRLEREAQAAARLAGHPGIVGVHDAGTHDDSVYLVMDFVEGRSLDHILRTEEPLPPKEGAQLIAKVARAVQHAHDNHVLHRDIKPANIMVTPEEQPRLTDFGLARSQQADHDVSRLTQSDEILGTPAYMPPEQACGEALDARADVYSLGATLYECLAGSPPFDGTSVVRVLTKVLHEAPRPLAQTAPGTPADLQRIVAQCLAKSREDRYPSAEALAADLDRFSRGEPVEARVVRRAARPMLAFAAAIAIFGTGAGALGWALTRDGGTPDSADAVGATRDRKAAEASEEYSDAWRALSRRAGPPLNRLLPMLFGSPATEEQALEIRAEIASIAAEVAVTHPRARSPQAWTLMARVLSGDEAALEPLRTLAATEGGDPFPRGVLALTLVVRYARMIDLPTATFVGDRLVMTERNIPEPLRLARAEVAEALGAMERAGGWEGITEGGELRALAAGAKHLSQENPHEATAELDAALDDTTVGNLARFLRGLAFSFDVNQARAADDLERCAAAGWLAAATHAGVAWAVVGIEQAKTGKEPAEAFERALRVLDQADALGSGAEYHNPTRITVYRAWCQAEQRLARSGRDQMQRCCELLQPLAQANANYALRYGRALRDLASIEIGLGNDARQLLHTAIGALRAAIAAFDAQFEADRGRGPWRLQSERTQEALARTQIVLAQQHQWRNDPAASTAYQQAIVTLQRLLEQSPGRASCYVVLGDATMRLARMTPGPAARPLWEAAVQAEREYLRLVGATGVAGNLGARQELAKALVYWAETRMSEVPPPIDLLDEATALLDEVIAGNYGSWQPLDLRARAFRLRSSVASDFEAAWRHAEAALADERLALRKSNNAMNPWANLIHVLRSRTSAAMRAERDPQACHADTVAEFLKLEEAYPSMGRHARTLASVGESAEFARDWDDALKWYRRALEAAPTWAALQQRMRLIEARKR